MTHTLLVIIILAHMNFSLSYLIIIKDAGRLSQDLLVRSRAQLIVAIPTRHLTSILVKDLEPAVEMLKLEQN